MREFKLVSNNIKLNILTKDVDNPSCIIIHIHGLCSNFQYDTFTINDFKNRINFLSQIDSLSFGLELQGNGKSDGLRGYIDNFDMYINNFDSLYHYVKYRYPKLPLFIIAESMGGLVISKMY